MGFYEDSQAKCFSLILRNSDVPCKSNVLFNRRPVDLIDHISGKFERHIVIVMIMQSYTQLYLECRSFIIIFF